MVGFTSGNPGIERQAQRPLRGLDGVKADGGRCAVVVASPRCPRSAVMGLEGDLEARSPLRRTWGLVEGGLRRGVVVCGVGEKAGVACLTTLATPTVG